MPKELPSWDKLRPEDAIPFGHIKLIAADLDGTLVQKGASDIFATISVLKRSLAHHRYGVAFTIATGRALAGVKILASKVDLVQDVPMVLYNGSLVLTHRTCRVLHQMTISHDVVRRVLDSTHELPVTVLTYHFADSRSTLFNKQDVQEVVFGWTNSFRYDYEFNGLLVNWCSDWQNVPSYDAISILISAESETIQAKVLKLMSKYGELSVTDSGGGYVEIRPRGSNKATGLEAVVKSLGISQSAVLALGDNDNDVEMLQWAGIGVCVGQASVRAMSHCDYQCRYDVEKGALEVLRLVRYARRYFHQPRNKLRGESYE